jgi:signal transduction histidine kinase
MNFLAYLKDRLFYIFIYILANVFTIIIMQLDRVIMGGRLKEEDIVYASILAAFFLCIYIASDYSRKKGVYNILNSIDKGKDSLESIFRASSTSNREHGLFLKILMKNFRVYEDKLTAYRDKQKEQIHFINQWAHQMKTPVSVINLMLEDNKEGLDKNQVESIREEVEKLSRGLEMALYTSRVNDFEQDFKVENVDIISVVRDVINEHKKEFIRYSVYPKVEQETGVMVKTDSKWIRFVINQIVVNSIKYSRYKDAERKSISVEASENDDYTVLSISDEGVGIPPEDIKRVFHPFFTGSNGRKFPESTGMGMYLSKVICTKLGHDIYIESSEGEWTKVTVSFHKGKSIHNLQEI